MSSLIQSRAVTEAPFKKKQLINVAVTSINGARPIAISRDGKFIYGISTANQKILMQTIDFGLNWTTVWTTTENKITSILELPSGEVLITTTNLSQTGRVWRTTGWGKTVASHAAATKTSILQPPNGEFYPDWSMNEGVVASNGDVYLNENGPQTSQATLGNDTLTDDSGARRIWKIPGDTSIAPFAIFDLAVEAVRWGSLSAVVDNAGAYSVAPTVVIPAPPAGGKQAVATVSLSGGGLGTITFSEPGYGYAPGPSGTPITFSGGVGAGGGTAHSRPTYNGIHLHASSYAEDEDRLYVTFGDNTGDGGKVAGIANLQLFAIDDVSKLTAASITANGYPVPSRFPAQNENFNNGQQWTPVKVTRDAVIVGGDDGSKEWMVFPRVGYRKLGLPIVASSWNLRHIAKSIWRKGGVDQNIDSPMLAVAKPVGLFQGPESAVIQLIDNYGFNWQEIYRKTDDRHAVQAVNGEAIAADSYFYYTVGTVSYRGYTADGGTFASPMPSAANSTGNPYTSGTVSYTFQGANSYGFAFACITADNKVFAYLESYLYLGVTGAIIMGDLVDVIGAD